MILEITFFNTRQLRAYLLEKQLDFNSPEEFHKWLFDYFEYGNTITVMVKKLIINTVLILFKKEI